MGKQNKNFYLITDTHQTFDPSQSRVCSNYMVFYYLTIKIAIVFTKSCNFLHLS